MDKNSKDCSDKRGIPSQISKGNIILKTGNSLVNNRIMSYVYVLSHNIMNKSEKFTEELQDIARFAKAISHPARLAILQYLAETKTCISGNISEYIPLSRSTVSQHLKELKDLGLIHGEIDGLKVNYCLCSSLIENYLQMFESFFEPIKLVNIDCTGGNQSDQNQIRDLTT